MAVERFLGFAPNLLSNLVRLIVNDLPYENLLERITTAYVGAVENLDRAVLTLQGGVERSGKPLFSIYWSERDKDSNEEE